MALIHCFQSIGGTSQVIQKTPLLARLTVLHRQMTWQSYHLSL